MAKDRVDRDEEDLVRLYLSDIGQYTLLTKDDEVRLAKQIESGKEAIAELDKVGKEISAVKKRELRRAAKEGEEAERSFVQSNLRLVVSHRQEVPGLWTSTARPHSRGQPGPHARSREVRLAQGLQVLHLCNMVDSPGNHPRHCQYRPYHSPSSSCWRHAWLGYKRRVAAWS